MTRDEHGLLLREVSRELRAAPTPREGATERNTATTHMGTGDSGVSHPEQERNIRLAEPQQDAAAMLDDVLRFVRRFVVMTENQAVAAALWVVHAHCPDAAMATPYLAVLSPEKRSGKSRLLEVLSILVPRPLLAGNATEAALFRALAEDPGPTLFLDETDTIFGPKAKRENESIRGLLNAGHRRDTPAIRCVGEGNKMRVERFNVFGAKALAGIGDLPDTVADRSIIIEMKRRAAGEVVERFRRRDVEPEADALRERIARWAERHIDTLAAARPTLPDDLSDRAADGWEPLFAIADAEGGDWPSIARKAALELAGHAADLQADDSLGVRLLRDVRDVFDVRRADRVTTADLLSDLVAMDEAPWGDLGGKEITPRRLGDLLRRYEVRSKSIRLEDGTTPKGYTRQVFEDAWERYLPHDGGSQAPHRHNPPGKTDYEVLAPATDGDLWRIENGRDPAPPNDCGGAADLVNDSGDSR